MDVYKIANENKNYIYGLRRYFHQNPELSWEEINTTKKIAEELEKLNIPYKLLPKTGLIATLEGNKKKPIIGLRADIDALPMYEKRETEFKSKIEGKMHACGHDAHIAMLLGAAKILSENKEKLECTIRFIFQPAEEVIQGAKTLLNEKEVIECDNLMAIHIFPNIPVGKISVEEGPRFTSADTIKIKILGKGGHGSMPHQTIDPIMVASYLVTSLQTIVSREIDPNETCIVSICTIHAGTLSNIIPNDVELTGTVRTFNPNIRKELPKIIERIIKNICFGFRANYEYEFIVGTPAVINEKESSKRAERAVEKILGQEGIIEYGKTSCGEDFAWLLEKIPGYLALVGCRNEEKDCIYPLHHEKFGIDEKGMINGTALFVQYVLETQNEILKVK